MRGDDAGTDRVGVVGSMRVRRPASRNVLGALAYSRTGPLPRGVQQIGYLGGRLTHVGANLSANAVFEQSEKLEWADVFDARAALFLVSDVYC
jgi:hypothetical protein